MDKSSPTSRQERFEQLRVEIDGLVARYPDMPPGRARKMCQEAIDARLEEIEDLNAQEREAFDAQKKEFASSSPSLWQPSGIIGAALFLLGAILSFYLAMVIGMVMLAIYATTFSPSRSSPAPEGGPKRYEWRP